MRRVWTPDGSGQRPNLRSLTELVTTDTDENAIGTDPQAACGAGAWPPDITGEGVVDFSDLNSIVPLLFQPAAGNERYNLSVDGSIDFQDLNAVLPFLFGSCT